MTQKAKKSTQKIWQIKKSTYYRISKPLRQLVFQPINKILLLLIRIADRKADPGTS